MKFAYATLFFFFCLGTLVAHEYGEIDEVEISDEDIRPVLQGL